MKVGRFVPGNFYPLPSENYLTLGARSEHNEIYEVRIETTPMTSEEARIVVGELFNLSIPGMEILGIEAAGDRVRFQFYSNSIAWLALIGILPSIIVPLVALVIGLIIAIRIPEWVWAIPFIGVGGGILIYSFLKGKG